MDLYKLAPVGYCTLSEQGLILQANLTAATVLGVARGRLIKQAFSRFISRDDQNAYYLQRKQLLNSGKPASFELRMVRADGSPFWANLACTLALEVDGASVSRIVLSDVSERKALDATLEQTRNQLLQSEKMAAIGQLAAGVAHEINNPVGFVNSNVGTLAGYLTGLLKLVDAYRLAAESCPADDPALREAKRLADDFELDYVRDDAVALLAESKDGLERIKRIVSDLKDFSHVDAVEWELFDLHACLERTLNVVWNELKYKVTLVKEYGELPAITGLPHQLSQVFMNLLINAVQAIPEHGTITLRTGREADSVWVEVEDSGVGIAPENLSRIFEPFFTTKPVGLGTGLGMAVSYGIVQKHKGRIEVRSVVGQGTTFRVSLPIFSAAAEDHLGARDAADPLEDSS
ncbi:MAG: ATP-binding protein [Betaproteobacteria bacterium]